MIDIQTHTRSLGTYVGIGLLLGVFALNAGNASAATVQPDTSKYNPTIRPADFSTNITNKYFSLPIGMKMEYEGETDEGIETIELSINGDTKMVMGVKTLVYHDRVWLDGELVEDTLDYLAQDKEGNVWYFGENVNNYEDGKLKDHDGTWIAGVDGAKPGIWMKANPKVGETYMQEYYKGEAEDYAKVLSTTETVKVPYGTLTNCLKTLDVNPFDGPIADEHKYYCPGVKGFALEVGVATGERIELVKSTTGSQSGMHNDDDDEYEGEDEDEEGDVDEDDDEVASADQTAKMQTLIELMKKLIALLLQQKGN